MNIILPDNLPETETLLYETENYSIILNADRYNKNSSVGLLMSISPHKNHPDIIPEENVDCDLDIENQNNASNVSDLPESYYSKFMKVIKMLETKFNLKYESNDESQGLCVHCTCGRSSLEKDLKFVAHLDEK